MATTTVLREDGSLLDKFDSAGRTVKDLLELLKEDGYNGSLRSQLTGNRVFPSTLLQDGDVYVFVVTKPRDEPWFLEHERSPGAFSLANSVPDMKKLLGREFPHYDLGRTSSAAPLVLTVEAFAQYSKHMRYCIPNTRDWDFVINITQMSSFYNNEAERQDVFKKILQEYLEAKFPNLTLRFQGRIEGEPKSDIRVEVLIGDRWVLLVIVEVKPEMGLRGEPCVEAMRYFAEYTVAMRKIRHCTFYKSSCPVLIIELVGPNIRVGGAAHYLDKPAHQPFTPYLHILKFLEDAAHWGVLSKAVTSIPVAVDYLVRFYLDLHRQQQAPAQSLAEEREPTLEWPYYMRTLQSQGATVSQQTLKQDARLTGAGRIRKMVFFVTLPDERRRIIKFSQRYGNEVHRLWADAGYAPDFTSTVLEDGNWQMVDMEFFAEGDGWRPVSALDPSLFVVGDDNGANKYRMKPEKWEACRKLVLEAYEVVHALDPVRVHGDMRRRNILFNVVTSRVAFVDFDWAGIEGQDRYPLLMNKTIDWAPGANPCALMAAQHDKQLLLLELGLDKV